MGYYNRERATPLRARGEGHLGSIQTHHLISPGAQLDDLPEVMTAAHVVSYLRGIYGRNAVYELLNSQRIRNRRHGQKFLIPKTALREFIECRSEDAGAGAPR